MSNTRYSLAGVHARTRAAVKPAFPYVLGKEEAGKARVPGDPQRPQRGPGRFQRHIREPFRAGLCPGSLGEGRASVLLEGVSSPLSASSGWPWRGSSEGFCLCGWGQKQ